MPCAFSCNVFVLSWPRGLYDEPEPVKRHILIQAVLEEKNGKEGDYWTPDILLEMVMGMFFAASQQPWSVSIQILRLADPTVSPHVHLDPLFSAGTPTELA